MTFELAYAVAGLTVAIFALAVAILLRSGAKKTSKR